MEQVEEATKPDSAGVDSSAIEAPQPEGELDSLVKAVEEAQK